MTETVVVIPGIMGSELFKDGRLIWPGTVPELLFPYDKMADLLDPGLTVGEIIGSFSVSEQYDNLLDGLRQCGFQSKGAEPTLATCPYDWRKDNAIAAERLAAKVKEQRQIHGKDLAINLVAHSMGGLVARYFLESGTYNEENCSGFSSIRSLITIGTPHRGAPLALAAALGQIKRLFLNTDQVKLLANTSGFPALYQLLPSVAEPFLWNLGVDARLEPKDAYDHGIAKSLGLSVANLESAASFHKGLDSSRRPQEIRYFCFVGTRQETPSYASADFTQAKPETRVVSLDDGGDGTVPSWSASIPGMQQLAVGGDHGTLYKTPMVRSVLGALLGKPGVLAEVGAAYRISVRDEVVTPQSPLAVVVFSRARIRALAADLVVTKLTGVDASPLTQTQEVGRYPLHYSGEKLDSLAVILDAPEHAGVYAIELVSEGVILTAESETFCVQRA